MRYLTMEHREVGGKSESHADLTFASERQGVASWLAAPASMGSLEFVSPDASMVTSAVIKNPRSIMEEIFKMIGSGDADFTAALAEFETKTGVNVLNDIAAPLGGEVTMAFDGPMVPTPRWKLIFEVYDPTTLQSTIAKLVDSFNREADEGALAAIDEAASWFADVLRRSAVRTQPNSEVDYTFVDSYLIAAPDMGTISRAIQSREAGYTLTHSSDFPGAVAERWIHQFFGDLLSQHRPGRGPAGRSTEVQRSADRAATPVGRRAHGKLRAGHDLCLWRARPDRGREQHRVHGI